MRHLDQCEPCRRRASMVVAALSVSPVTWDSIGEPTEVERPAASCGTRLGRYVLGERLGFGGMGEVFRAYDPELDRHLAVKLLWRNDAAPRLLNEARAAARLVHPNVVTVYDIGTEQGRAFIATELLEGGTLATWLQENRPPPEQILQGFLAAGEGLAAAHRVGLVHRDFKPANVLMDLEGCPKIADFGLARATPAPSEPADLPGPTTSVSGTPGYMAPEQYVRRCDVRSDEFAFCVALWEALTGSRPFPNDDDRGVLAAMQGEPHGILPPSLGRHVRATLLRGLSFRPDDRFLSMEVLLQELRRPVRRRKTAPRVALGLAAAFAVGLAAFLMLQPAREPALPSSPASPGSPTPASGEPRDPATSGESAPEARVEPRDPPIEEPPAPRIEPRAPEAPGDRREEPLAASRKRTPRALPGPNSPGGVSQLSKGRIAFRVHPWAEVSLDGKPLGVTPLSPVEVESGEHSVVLTNPELGTHKTFVVKAREGQEVVVQINLLE